jgi:hypothetical protein
MFLPFRPVFRVQLAITRWLKLCLLDGASVFVTQDEIPPFLKTLIGNHMLKTYRWIGYLIRRTFLS